MTSNRRIAFTSLTYHQIPLIKKHILIDNPISIGLFWSTMAEALSELSQTSKMKLSAKLFFVKASS